METIILKHEEIKKLQNQIRSIINMPENYSELIAIASSQLEKKEEEFEKYQDLVINIIWNDIFTYQTGEFFYKNINGTINYVNIRRLVNDGKKNDFDYDYDYDMYAKPLKPFLGEKKLLDLLIKEIDTYGETESDQNDD